jgi:hypothetical protein
MASKSLLQFKVFAWLQSGWDVLKYGILAIAALTLGVGVALAFIRKSDDPDKIALVK